MNPKHYRSLGAVLENVLATVRMVHEMGFWMELVTLVVPGFNDDEAELREAARFIHSVSPTIPWHVTAFHSDYRMLDHAPTQARALVRTAEIGYEEGLHYVYAGNLPGRVGPYEDTRCPECGATLIERLGYVITGYHLRPASAVTLQYGGASAKCPACGTAIPGIWPASPAEVHTGTAADLYHRRPRPMR
jgi:pyruvate formate lyase activating enzyme